MPRLTLAVIATAALLAAGAPLLAQDAPQGGSPGAGPPPARSPQGHRRVTASKASSRYRRRITTCRPFRRRPARSSPAPSRNRRPPSRPCRKTARRCWPSCSRIWRKAPDAAEATPIAEAIEGMLLQTDSATIGVLMGRSAKAINDQKNELALQLLDAVVELGAGLCRGLEPARLRALHAEQLSKARSAICAARWRSSRTTSRRSRDSPASCARPARRKTRCRPTSRSSRSTRTRKAPRGRRRVVGRGRGPGYLVSLRDMSGWKLCVRLLPRELLTAP